MRHKGRITRWNDQRGFGFIAPATGGDEVFVHIKAFRNRQRRPVDQALVTYELNRDPRGRLQGANVRYSGEQVSSGRTSSNGSWALLAAGLFLAGLAAGTALQALPAMVLWIYLTASAATFAAYAWDKSAAQSNRWRTSESTLLLLGLAGGWPGALVAQRMLRHKSRKRSFQLAFWLTVAMNIAGLVWIAFGQDFQQ
jgi:uncharacterized membrane protein YsdA (DUF1294 family)/cold shock CspA family protein